MPTVFRRPNSQYWQAAFCLPGGKRVYRSTKKTRRADAVVAAAEMERSHRRKSGHADDHSRRVLSVLEEAGECAIRGALTEATARQFLRRMVELSTGAEMRLPSIEDWFSGWLSGKERSRTGGTYRRYAGVVRGFLRSLPPPRRAAPVESLSIAEIQAYRDRLADEGRSAATVNGAVKILSGPLNHARRQGIITHNPAEGVELLAADSAERSVFGIDQIRSLIDAAEGDWKGLILAGFYTGARLGDLAALQWKQLDMDRSIVSFVQAKTKRPVEIPLHPEFTKWLQSRNPSTRPPAEPLFPTLAARGSRGRTGLSRQFAGIMAKAGIKGIITKPNGKKGRARSSLSFHSLRHSFNSAMANAGVSQELRQRLTGHASKAMNDRYTHTELDTLRRAVKAVPTFGDIPKPDTGG